MAGYEYEAEQIVTHVIVERSVEIRHSHLPGLEIAGNLLVFAFEPRVAAEVIDGTMFGSHHEPGTRILRNT